MERWEKLIYLFSQSSGVDDRRVESLEEWKRTMWILWAGVLMCSASYTMSVPFLPLFLFDLGVDESSVHIWAGVIYSSAFIIGAVMGPFWGGIADKYGKRKMVIRAGISLCIIYALLSIVQTPWQLLMLRLLHGLMSGFVPASMSIVASRTPEKEMGWSLGMMHGGAMFGTIMGPLMGGLLADWFGIRHSFIASSIIMLAAVLAVIVFVTEGKAESGANKRVGLLETFKSAGTNKALLHLLILLIIYQLSINMIQPLLTLHIANMQGKLQGAVLTSGIVFSIIGIAGIIAAPVWGRIGQALSYQRSLFICMFCAGCVISGQYFVDKLWLFTVVQFMFGLFIAGISPAVNTLVVASTDKSFRGRSFGLMTSANQTGAMLGPLIGGLLGSLFGIHWVFVATGVILVCTGLAVRVKAPGTATPSDQHLS
jgi:DHA1 family multidrug resistance protein-like MFS transporter